MAQVYKIDGALYRMVERSTLAQDFYVMRHLRAAGLANCTPNEGESAQDFALRLMSTVVERGAPIELLAGLLLPEGVPDEKWSPETAASTAALLSIVTDPADKAEIQKVLVAIITDFFREGLRSSQHSRIVLRGTRTQPGSGTASALRRASASSPISASGGKWYARLPIIRSIASAR